MKNEKEKFKNKSFTLIEIMVAVTIFSIITLISSGIFISGLQAQRKILIYQELLDQTNYALEYISRSLKMARKELLSPACLSQNGLNYEISWAGDGLKFVNSQGLCQEFFWDKTTNRLKESKGGTEGFLTSADFEIKSFKIKLKGESQEDLVQPRVTVFWEIAGRDSKIGQPPTLKIQTTISQRNLDLRY